MFKKREEFDVNNKIILNFWDISNTIRRISEGKGSQKRILMLLKENEDITQKELTERLGIQSGSASEVIGKLETAGLIVRTPNSGDLRTMNVSLTEAGKTEADDAYGKREERHRMMFACLSEEEKESLLGLLEKINFSWKQQYGKDDKQGERIKERVMDIFAADDIRK